MPRTATNPETDRTAWVTLRQVAEYLGARRAGRPTHVDTVRECVRVGLCGVKLRARLRGGVWMTKLREVQRFSVRVQLAKERQREQRREEAARVRTPARRERDRERARRENERDGAR